MVFLENWDEYQEAATNLFLSHPTRTRCTMKYRHVDEKLEVKVTNDVVCLKFKTKQHTDLR